jgi:dsRNA-specific ribonuclease
LHSNGLVETPKALADIVEAAIGAVFIDSNFSIDVVWKVRTLFPTYGVLEKKS